MGAAIARAKGMGGTLRSVSIRMAETGKRKKVLAWVLGGVGVEILGAVLIWQSLPGLNERTTAGLVCVVIGSLVVTWGLVQKGRLNPPAATPAVRPTSGWRPETELQSATPRAVRLSRSGRRLVGWWAMLLLALPLYAYFVSQRAGGGTGDYQYEYVEGEAVIHDKNVRETAGGKRFYLYYNFESTQVTGTFRASTAVSEQQYNRYNVGDTLTVLYLAPNPTVHEVPELKQQTASPQVIWFVAGVGGLLLLVFEAIRRRHKTITTLGVATAGRIVMLHRRGAGSVYSVKYDAGGEQRTLRASERTRDLNEGDLISVLYRPGKPEQALIYRLSMYEARPPGA